MSRASRDRNLNLLAAAAAAVVTLQFGTSEAQVVSNTTYLYTPPSTPDATTWTADVNFTPRITASSGTLITAGGVINSAPTALTFLSLVNGVNSTTTDNITNAAGIPNSFFLNELDLINGAQLSTPTTLTIAANTTQQLNFQQNGPQDPQPFINLLAESPNAIYNVSIPLNFQYGGNTGGSSSTTALGIDVLGNASFDFSGGFNNLPNTSTVYSFNGSGTVTFGGYGTPPGPGSTSMVTIIDAPTIQGEAITAVTAYTFGNGTYEIAPATGVATTETGMSNSGSTYRIQGAETLELNAANSANSLTLVFGTNATTTGWGGIVHNGSQGVLPIQSAQGLAQLGGQDKLIALSGTTNNIPAMTNGVYLPWVVGVGNDTAASADFLSYVGRGISTDYGFVTVSNYASYLSAYNAAYSGSTGVSLGTAPTIATTIGTSSATTVTELTSTQASAATAAAYDLSVTNSTLTLATHPLTISAGLILNGATIGNAATSGGDTSAAIVTLSASAEPIYVNGNNGTIADNVSSSGGFVKFGPGTLYLTDTTVNSVGGVQYILDGAVDVGNIGGGTNSTTSGHLGSGALYLGGGILEANGAFNRSIVNGGSYAVAFNITGNVSANQTSSNGGFAASGAGATGSSANNLTVNLGNQVTPSTLTWQSLGNGTAELSGTSGFLSNNSMLLLSSATANGVVTLQNNIDLGDADRELHNSLLPADYYRNVYVATGQAGSSAAISGVISDGANAQHGLLKDGGGMLNISGANTYDGSTYVNNGTLQLGNGQALSDTAAATTVTMNGTLDLNGQTVSNGKVFVLQGGSLVNSNTGAAATLATGVGLSFTYPLGYLASNAGYSAVPTVTISGGGGTGATATDSGKLTLSSYLFTTNSATFSTVPTAVTFTDTSTGATVTAQVSATGGTTAAYTITGLKLPSFVSNWSGSTVTETVTGGGTQTGTLLITPQFSLNLNSIALTAGTGYTSTPTATLSSGPATAVASFANIQLATNTNSSIGGPGNMVVGSVISGTGSLTKIGNGQVSLGGINTYTGTTAVSAGSFGLTSGAVLGDTAITVSNNATFFAAAGTSAGTAAHNASLTAATGAGINLADGTVGNFTVNGTGTALSLSGGTLSVDLQAAGADDLLTTVAGAVSGTELVNVSASGALTPGTYAIITANAGLANTATFEFSNFSSTITLASGGLYYPASFSSDANDEDLVIGAGTSAAPEPGSCTLILGGAAVGMLRRRRRANRPSKA